MIIFIHHFGVTPFFCFDAQISVSATILCSVSQHDRAPIASVVMSQTKYKWWGIIDTSDRPDLLSVMRVNTAAL